MGAKYGDPPPDVTGRRVWILDFSYPRGVTRDVILRSRSTKVIDHHKTAEASLAGLLDEIQHVGQRQVGDEIVFDMERSGAGLLWDYLTKDGYRGSETPLFQAELGPPVRRPWLVDYVEDRDLWWRLLPFTASVSAWIAAQPMTFQAWDNMFDAGLEHAVALGAAVEFYIRQYGTKARAQQTRELVLGHSVPCINLPYMNCSEHVGALAEENQDALFAVGYFRRGDGRWQFSLRSRNGFDVSEVAKAFGGGGHAGAAGFDVEDLSSVFA